MYETEVNAKVELPDQLPPEALASFGALRGKILSRTVLPWSEHCTECVWPSCYTTCDLYSPREDGRCRRFVDGMVRVDCPTAFNGYLLKIRFKQWGKLWTPANLRLRSAKNAARLEKRDHRIGAVLYQIALPAGLKTTVITKRYSFKKRMARRGTANSELSTSFLVECFNPMDQAISLSFTIRSFQAGKKIPFQKRLEVQPGFQVIRIPVHEMASVVDLNAPFHVEMIPNEIGREITLYFGLMDFVREVEQPAKMAKVKCVVWDLDNTVWDGVLIEDGPARLQLKPGIIQVMKELDRRGILQSIASKNNHDDAIAVLKSFQIDDLFLFPQISWAPKSAGVSAIAQKLNIGIDTLLFIDDSEFELEQVRMAQPKVRVLHAKEYPSLLEREECRVPVTAESRERRKMYQVEQARQQIAEGFKDDYSAFLKHCNIQLEIQPLTDENLERVHELTQRTNQMNFSGNRYDRAMLRRILQTSHLDTYVMSCEDRFGSYGIIGFGIVDSREPRLTDLMFSCRVQAKRVEHAFLSYVLQKYIAASRTDFHADYRKTPRNAPSGQVFADMGMQEVEVSDGVTRLVFRTEMQVPDDGIITINTYQVVSVG